MITLLLTSAALAQQPPRIDIQRFDPIPQPNGFARVWEGDLPDKGAWSAGVAANYAMNPFELGQTDGARSLGIVDHMVGVDLAASYSLHERFMLGGTLPVAQLTFESIDTDLYGAIGANSGLFSLGDATLYAAIGLVNNREAGFGLALVPHVVVPSGTVGSLTAMRSPQVGGDIAVSSRGKVARLSLNVGYRYNYTSATVLNLHPDDELRVGLGMGFPLTNGAEIGLELVAATNVSPFLMSEVGASVLDPAHTPAELTLSFRPPAAGRLIKPTIGGGPGLTKGFGTPDGRGFGMLRVSNWPPAEEEEPPPPPPEPEVVEAPPPPQPTVADRDGDGLIDTKDRCPDDPEDWDNWEDRDGCPDNDNDFDKLWDWDDRCPNEPEDRDGWEDEDGCPDPDNDMDGLPDLIDVCPDEAEIYNGFEDDDGCPDQGKPLVAVTAAAIEIFEKVYFDYNRATIKEVSYPLLEIVADVIKRHPEILLVEVGGHTDSDGGDDYNKKLSDKRANAVRKFLMDAGVDGDRLTAVGYGEEQPIDTNSTDDGKANNRRVEFLIKARSDSERKR